MFIKKIEKNVEIVDGINLKCPSCGNVWTHSGDVFVFNRDEDAETTIVTEVNWEKVSQSVRESRFCMNPSLRRHGILIEFDCECCGEKHFYLGLSQHKGETHLEYFRKVQE